MTNQSYINRLKEIETSLHELRIDISKNENNGSGYHYSVSSVLTRESMGGISKAITMLEKHLPEIHVIETADTGIWHIISQSSSESIQTLCQLCFKPTDTTRLTYDIPDCPDCIQTYHEMNEVT